MGLWVAFLFFTYSIYLTGGLSWLGCLGTSEKEVKANNEGEDEALVGGENDMVV